MTPHPLKAPWNQGIVAVGVVSVALAVASSTVEVVVGGWGTLTGWTLIGSSVVLGALALTALVRRASVAVAGQSWTSVWLPLVFIVLDVGVAAAVFAVARALWP